MEKVYSIAREAGMNPDQFCRIRNGCFGNEEGATPALRQSQPSPPESIPFRGIMASTKVSEFLGVEAVSARDYVGTPDSVTDTLQPKQQSASRPWWYEVGDYLENPHRHFDYISSLIQTVDWPEEVRKPEK